MERNCFIALGSNLGDKRQYLLSALARIEEELGTIVQVSSPYETESWGFEAPPFINACLQLQTALPPLALLERLQQIEKDLGRQASAAEQYSSRTLDLDLLFYGDRQLNTESLTLPHPRLQLRNFVLDPLVEIAAEFEHPYYQKSMQALQAACEDTTAVQQLPFRYWLPPLFDSRSYIAISGTIGSGKTTLTQQLAADYGIHALYEQFEENPYLADFYQRPEDFALETERFFLNSRIQQLSPPLATPLVSDFWLEKSLVFAQETLPLPLFQEFEKQFKGVAPQSLPPDLLVYLHRPVAELLQQIKKRGRQYEQGIPPSYLEKIEKGYARLLATNLDYPIAKIDCTGLFWEPHSYAYIQLVQQLASF